MQVTDITRCPASIRQLSQQPQSLGTRVGPLTGTTISPRQSSISSGMSRLSYIAFERVRQGVMDDDTQVAFVDAESPTSCPLMDKVRKYQWSSSRLIASREVFTQLFERNDGRYPEIQSAVHDRLFDSRADSHPATARSRRLIHSGWK